MDKIKGLSFGSVTLVEFLGDYPRESGNCFSLLTEEDAYVKILNFNHENLKKLIDDGVVSFPIIISKLSEYKAVIVDGRIPDEWYSNKFCEVCTPDDLLPLPQKIKHQLEIDRGNRVETNIEINGEKFKQITIKPKLLPGNYTINIDTGKIERDE